jgi:hypothetical protein
MNSFLHNLTEARAFLDHLDPSATAFTFQTFDDSKQRREARAEALKAEMTQIKATVPAEQRGAAIARAKNKHRDPYARIIEGRLDEVAGQLAELNRQGAGVFVTVNRTRMDKTRKADSIVGVRAVFVDLDGAPLAPVERFPLVPHLTIESSPGRYHAYWLVGDLPLDEYKPTQKAIIERFNGDVAVHDLPRVMRLPGFYHQKEDAPFMTRMHARCATGIPYTAAQVRAAFLAGGHNSSGAQSDGSSRFAAGDIPQGERNATLMSIAGRLRSEGMSQAAIESELGAINRARCKPPLDEAEVMDIAGRYANNEQPADWPEAQEIPDPLPPVPAFPPDLLPDALRPWIMDAAARIQCPIDYIAIPAMVAAGALIGARIAAKAKQVDDWHEVPNLFGLVVGSSGSKKSPALGEALKWIRALQYEEDDLYAQEYGNFELAKAMHAADLAGKKAKHKSGKYALTVQDLQEPAAPARVRHFVNDTTVEALGVILQDNPNGVLVVADEIVGLLSRLDGEERRADRTFYLEAYNGKDSFTVDRITRPPVRIPRLCLSVLGTTQPDVLRAYMRQTIMGGVGNDGLMARFQLAVYPDHARGPLPFIDRAPDAAASQQADQVFRRLSILDPITVGAQRVPNCRIPMLGFSAAAQPLMNQWLNEVDNRLLGDQHPALTSHYSKFRKTMPTLALIIHLIDGGTGPISEQALRKAMAWINYLSAHARRIYAAVSKHHIDAARALAKYIRNGKLKDGFTARDIYLNGWTGLATPEDARMAVDVLLDLGWLQAHEERTGGRPKVRYSINPALTKRAA